MVFDILVSLCEGPTAEAALFGRVVSLCAEAAIPFGHHQKYEYKGTAGDRWTSLLLAS